MSNYFDHLLLRFSGQQLAQQMQQSNPELVEQLRTQMRGQSNAASSDDTNTNEDSQPGNLYSLLSVCFVSVLTKTVCYGRPME